VKLIKFLPSYVGSKAYWVPLLQNYKGEDFVEVFAGSGVLSANLAKTAILNDKDPIIHKVFSNFLELEAPESFSAEDYFTFRKVPDWWRYIYCLQRMSFSGVFRYSSKGGFNVPIKKVKKDGVYINPEPIHPRADCLAAKERFKELNPTILNLSYEDIPLSLMEGKVVVFDPPYEGSQASYNTAFDYEKYWELVKTVSKIAKTVIIFDSKKNIEKHGYETLNTRKMRVNGKHQGDVEAIAILGEIKPFSK
jgi:site-specific DNA-adenine methylase